MTDQEQEIVARALYAESGHQRSWEDAFQIDRDIELKAAARAISALDSHRANNAGEVEFQPWCPSCRATSANDKRCGVCATETVFQARDVSRAITIISSLRAVIAEKDEALDEVMNYRRGKGKYDFLHLPDEQRENAIADAWHEVELCVLRARSTISDSTPHPPTHNDGE